MRWLWLCTPFDDEHYAIRKDRAARQKRCRTCVWGVLRRGVGVNEDYQGDWRARNPRNLAANKLTEAQRLLAEADALDAGASRWRGSKLTTRKD